MNVRDVLAESESRFAALFEHNADALLVVSTDGRITMSNPAASRLFGYSSLELAAMTVEGLIPARQRGRHRDLRAGFHRSPHARLMSESSPLTVLTKAGVEVPVEIGLGPLTLRGYPMVLTSIRDVSSRVLMNERLRLASQQAAESQKFDALGRLAGGIAHDFNNLLTIIISSSEALALRELDPQSADIVREIVLASQRATEITSQLLTLSRSRKGGAETTAISERVSSFSPLLERLLGPKVVLNLQLGAGVKPVLASAANVDQVLLNLVINARDAMGHGGTITVRTSHEELETAGQRREWSVLEVVDEGEGMDEATRRRIFEPFFTTKADGRGTGLGLATVHAIVVQAGGEVTVVSQPGKGSAFRVLFPVAGASADSRSILVVDDHAGVRTLVSRVLRDAGFHVRVASDAVEALSLLDSNAADLLITDVQMPGTGGVALAETVRVKNAALPVLLLSESPVEQLTAPCSVLLKPFATDALLARTEALLKGANEEVRLL